MSVLKSGRNQSSYKELYEFTQGIDVDARLAKQEIAVQIAWARALVKIAVIEENEFRTAEKILRKALNEILTGRFEWRVEDEDIHMNLERYVTAEAGDIGKKIHLGRSRNDLIATTLRLFVADALIEIQSAVKQLIRDLCARAEKDIEILVPGLTHVQHGQPIRYSHSLIAHGIALSRDLTRLVSALGLAKKSMPLGAAALGGTPLAIDLSSIAKELGFQNASENSYDSVGDRDFILEALNAISIVAVHLSRLSEDFIYASSTAVGLLKLPKDWSTGSSIMPNKRNPDVPELVRAKSAHMIGAATDGHALMKAVGMSYGSDLHELKTVFMRSFDECLSSVKILSPFIKNLEVDRKRAEELLNKGHILATEVADALVAAGLPFREAYKKVAVMVEEADSKGLQIHQLSIAGLSPPTFESAVEKRKNSGGTAKSRVLQSIEDLKAEIS